MLGKLALSRYCCSALFSWLILTALWTLASIFYSVKTFDAVCEIFSVATQSRPDMIGVCSCLVPRHSRWKHPRLNCRFTAFLHFKYVIWPFWVPFHQRTICSSRCYQQSFASNLPNYCAVHYPCSLSPRISLWYYFCVNPFTSMFKKYIVLCIVILRLWISWKLSVQFQYKNIIVIAALLYPNILVSIQRKPFPETIKLRMRLLSCAKELVQNMSWSVAKHYGFKCARHYGLTANGRGHYELLPRSLRNEKINIVNFTLGQWEALL